MALREGTKEEEKLSQCNAIHHKSQIEFFGKELGAA
jgi:hypothetical protein